MAQSITIMLRDVRCVWPKLFRAEEFREKKRYSVGLLIEGGSDQEAKLKEAIKAAVAQQYGPAEVEARLKKYKATGVTKLPIKEYEGQENTKIITPKRDESKGPPLVLDGRKRKLEESSGLPYAGCWVNASVDVFCHNREGGGLAFYLNGVQLVREDAALAGTRTAESFRDDFDDLGDTGVAEVSAEADDFI